MYSKLQTIAEEPIRCLLSNMRIHFVVSSTLQRHRILALLRKFGTAEQLTVRTFQRLPQTNVLFNLSAPYICSLRYFTCRWHEYQQQKTGDVQNTNDHEKHSLRKTCARLYYRSISRHGRLQNNSALHRKNIASKARSRTSWKGGRKFGGITGSRSHMDICQSSEECSPTALLATSTWYSLGACQVRIRSQRSRSIASTPIRR